MIHVFKQDMRCHSYHALRLYTTVNISNMLPINNGIPLSRTHIHDRIQQNRNRNHGACDCALYVRRKAAAMCSTTISVRIHVVLKKRPDHFSEYQVDISSVQASSTISISVMHFHTHVQINALTKVKTETFPKLNPPGI